MKIDKNKNKKVLTIGGATQDYIIEYNDPETLDLHSAKQDISYLLLEEGKKIEVTKWRVFTGGGATNSAASFKRLGFDVAPCCVIGDDIPGQGVLDELSRSQIDISFIHKIAGQSTGSSFVVPSLKGDRAVFAYRGVSSMLKEEHISESKIAEIDFIYITSLSGEASSLFPYITKLAKKYNKLVAANPGGSQLDAGSSFVKNSLVEIDILILNHEEAKLLWASLLHQDVITKSKPPESEEETPKLLFEDMPEDISFNVRTFFEKILKRGPSIVVVTNGDEGVYVAENNEVDTIYYHPSLKGDVVNTLGAGDAFGSCFVACIMNGDLIEDAMRKASVNSLSVIGHMDAKTGLLTEKQLASELKKHKKINLTQYELQNKK